LFILGFVVFWVIKWLFSRTSLVQQSVKQPNDDLPWWTRLWTAFIVFYRKMLRSIRGYQRAMELYDALLRWGKRSGLCHPASETPLEFAARLSRCFPYLNREINLIVNAFHEEVYAGSDLFGKELVHARWALRRLRSPLHWPLRMKVRFSGTGDRVSSAMKN
jgi:hypothetical protein